MAIPTIPEQDEEENFNIPIKEGNNTPHKPLSPIHRKVTPKNMIEPPTQEKPDETVASVPETPIPPHSSPKTAGNDQTSKQEKEEEEEKEEREENEEEENYFDYIQPVDPLTGRSLGAQLEPFVSVPPVIERMNYHADPNGPTREEMRSADLFDSDSNKRMSSFLEELADTDNGEFFRLISSNHKGSDKILHNALKPNSRKETREDWNVMMNQPANKQGIGQAFNPSTFGTPKLGSNGRVSATRRWLGWLGHKDKNFKYFGNNPLKEYESKQPEEDTNMPPVPQAGSQGSLIDNNERKPTRENFDPYLDELRHAKSSKKAALAIFQQVASKKGLNFTNKQAAEAVDWIQKNLGASINKTLQEEKKGEEGQKIISKSGKQILHDALQQKLFKEGVADSLAENKFVALTGMVFRKAREDGKDSLTRDEIATQVASEFLDDYKNKKMGQSYLRNKYNIAKLTDVDTDLEYKRITKNINKISNNAHIVATPKNLMSLPLKTTDDSIKYNDLHSRECKAEEKKLETLIEQGKTKTGNNANEVELNQLRQQLDNTRTKKNALKKAKAKLSKNKELSDPKPTDYLDKQSNVYKAYLLLTAEEQLNTPPNNELHNTLAEIKTLVKDDFTTTEQNNKNNTIDDKIKIASQKFSQLRALSVHQQDPTKQHLTNKAATFVGKELLDQVDKSIDNDEFKEILNNCAGKGSDASATKKLSQYLSNFNQRITNIQDNLSSDNKKRTPSPIPYEQKDFDAQNELIKELQQCKEVNKQEELISRIKALQHDVVAKASERFVTAAQHVDNQYNGKLFKHNRLKTINAKDVENDPILSPVAKEKAESVQQRTIDFLKNTEFAQNIAGEIDEERMVRDFQRATDNLGQQTSSFSHGKLSGTVMSETNLDTVFAGAIDQMLKSDGNNGGGNIFKLLSKKYRNKDDDEWQQRLEKAPTQDDVFDNGIIDRTTNFVDFKNITDGDIHSKDSIKQTSKELRKYLQEASPLFSDVSDAEASELIIKYILPALRGGIGPGKSNYIGSDKNAVNNLRTVIRQTLRNPDMIHQMVEKSALGRRVAQHLGLQHINTKLKDKHWYQRLTKTEKLNREFAKHIRNLEQETNDHCMGIVQVTGGIRDPKDYQVDRIWVVFENTDKNRAMEAHLPELYKDSPENQKVFGKQRSSIYREYNHNTGKPTGNVMISAENDVLTAFNNGVMKIHDKETFKKTLQHGGLSFDSKITEKKGNVNYVEDEHIILGKDGTEVTIKMGFKKIEGNSINNDQNKITNLLDPDQTLELKFNKDDAKAFKDYFEPQRKLSVTDAEIDHHKHYTEFQDLWQEVSNIKTNSKEEEEKDTAALIDKINAKAKQLEEQGCSEEATHIKQQINLIKPLKQLCRQTAKCKANMTSMLNNNPNGLDKGPLEKMCAKIPDKFQEQIYNVFIGEAMYISDTITKEAKKEGNIGNYFGNSQQTPPTPPTPSHTNKIHTTNSDNTGMGYTYI